MRKNKLITQVSFATSAFPLLVLIRALGSRLVAKVGLAKHCFSAASLDVDLIMVVPSSRPFCTISSILVTGLLMSYLLIRLRLLCPCPHLLFPAQLKVLEFLFPTYYVA